MEYDGWLAHPRPCLKLKYPPWLHSVTWQLKKKKQAAKRKSIAAEGAEPETSAKATNVSVTSSAPNTPASKDVAGGNGTIKNGIDGKEGAVLVDEDMPDVPDTADTRQPLKDADACGQAAKCTVKGDGNGSTDNGSASLGPSGGVPHANGKHAASKHKKSVSFVMNEADVDSVLSNKFDSKRDGQVIPPLPPPTSAAGTDVNVAVGEEDCFKDEKLGANEAFLRRNFDLGGPKRVRKS